MEHLRTSEDLFIEQLKEQYAGERHQRQTLQKLRGLTNDPELQQLIDHHIGKTKKQISGLVKIFIDLQRNPHGEINLAVEGLAKEALQQARRSLRPEVRDESIIDSVRSFNYYNMGLYKSLAHRAKDLGYQEESIQLKRSFEEEKETEAKLFEQTISISAKKHTI